MSASRPIIAVLATMNTKSAEAHFIASVLERAGVAPCIVDLSMRPHDLPAADITGEQVARLAGTSWQALNGYVRQEAAAVMVEGGIKLLHEKYTKGDIAGAIGIGGANGTNLVCSILRSLPYLVPKVMVSTVAGTAAVQWYVAESDIAMYPSIGDISLNRITTAIMENAANAVAIAARNHLVRRKAKSTITPLVAVSSFGGTANCVERVSQRLQALGYEIILFHASGVGGKSLERLSLSGELAGVVDVTTHELTDLIVEGVYSAGEARMSGAGAAGLPQVIAPGAIDHANFWVGQVPDRYKTREFFQYNAQNLLMRTNTDEFRILGEEFAKRLNSAKGPIRILIPLEGFSEHSKRRACNLNGDDKGPWKHSDDYRVFVDSLRSNLKSGQIEELPLHINDNAFADACVDAFIKIAKT